MQLELLEPLVLTEYNKMSYEFTYDNVLKQSIDKSVDLLLMQVFIESYMKNNCSCLSKDVYRHCLLINAFHLKKKNEVNDICFL